jgi:hypothetical protein
MGEAALEKDGAGAEGVAVSSCRVVLHPIHHRPGNGRAASVALQMPSVLAGSEKIRMRPKVTFLTRLAHQHLTPWRRGPLELD